jgi:outer membrane protein
MIGHMTIRNTEKFQHDYMITIQTRRCDHIREQDDCLDEQIKRPLTAPSHRSGTTGSSRTGCSRRPALPAHPLLQVKIAEGALYPSLQAVGNVQKNFGASPQTLGVLESLSRTIAAQLSVPLYQGGAEYSTIRQAKETLGQRRLDLDTARDQVQAAVVRAWGQLEAAKAQIIATQAQVTAAEVALNGVREEARVGQRTTLDVLHAQQTLVNVRVALVTAQRDRVVASYTVLASVDSLSPQVLGLRIEVYDAMAHYQQVRDVWGGVRIPDGR